ncbi:MAG TPA: hypothetical protein V6D50_15535 [Chroococcales cyanobacterium]
MKHLQELRKASTSTSSSNRISEIHPQRQAICIVTNLDNHAIAFADAEERALCCVAVAKAIRTLSKS